LIYIENALIAGSDVQEFTWTSDGEPVCLDDAMVAFRFWKDGKIEHSVSTTDGSVTIGKSPGEFSLHLNDASASEVGGCSIYDVIAWLPEHGMRRVTKGKICSKSASPGTSE
jgi:hypothetical protein